MCSVDYIKTAINNYCIYSENFDIDHLMAALFGCSDFYYKMAENTQKIGMSPPYSEFGSPQVDHKRVKYPYCIVWTPIPLLTWLFPIIGHMGIGMSSGIIRDFAGPYYVSEDNMAFGRPTKYWQLTPNRIVNEQNSWDRAVSEASEEYKHRMHNLCWDNCHSHVAMALNLMQYDNSMSWNMVKLCFLILIHGKYVNIWGFLKTWLPFFILIGLGILVGLFIPFVQQMK